MNSPFNILVIETSGAYLGVGLYQCSIQGKTAAPWSSLQPKPLADYFFRTPGRQSELLFPTLDRLLKKAKLKRDNIDLVAVDVGPGSFTGVRVGVATARALSQGLSVPLVGVTSLHAMAQKAATHPHNKNKVCFAPCLPALAGELYYAVYKRTETPAGRAELISIKDPCWVSTDAFTKALRKMKMKTPLILNGEPPPHPKAIVEIALDRYLRSKNRTFPYEAVVPLYLQPSWAERRKAPFS